MFKFVLLFLLIVIFDCAKAQQIINDECGTAVELFRFPFTTGTQHCDNAVPNWIGGDNIFQYATPSVPFYSMVGCNGYSNSTTFNSDDIWFKFKSSTPSTTIWIDSDDTMNVAIYNGVDCGSLLPSGCFTYLPSYWDTAFGIFTSSDTLVFNFIQISSVAPGRAFSFNACVHEYGNSTLVWPFGTIQINTDMDENYSLPLVDLYPNPCQNRISFAAPNLSRFVFNLYDIYGRNVRNYIVSVNTSLDISDLSDGIYYYDIQGLMGINKTGKLIKN